MYCKKSLGANEVVEEFPVGRRLAFDPAKGRLWVVCRRCDRWNLTPLEERWEAVERCERLFRDTRVRHSTGNIGLARLPEGLELVRIGRPLRPEFSAWRYGDRLGSRRRRRIATYATVGGAFAGAIAFAGATGGLGAALSVFGYHAFYHYLPVTRFRPSDGRLRRLNHIAAGTTVVDRIDGKLWTRTSRGILPPNWVRHEWFEGDDAHRALNAVMPWVNTLSGRQATVQSAVAEIESQGHAERFVTEVISRKESRSLKDGCLLAGLPKSTRLAFEMALHEEDERRALEGELRRLERAWREAEEIAAIADNLLLPRRARRIDRLRRRHAGRDADERNPAAVRYNQDAREGADDGNGS